MVTMEEIISFHRKRADGLRPQASRYWHEDAANLLEGSCLCNVGVQECPVHPGHLMTKEEKIQFRKDWDKKVVEPSWLERM